MCEVVLFKQIQIEAEWLICSLSKVLYVVFKHEPNTVSSKSMKSAFSGTEWAS